MEVIYTVEDKWPAGKFYAIWSDVYIELSKAALRRSMEKAEITHVRLVYYHTDPLGPGYYVLRGWGIDDE